MILFLTGNVCYGAVSEDMSVYLRKDVFDAKMDAFMSEIRLMNEQVRSEIRTLDAKIEGVETSLNAKIDGNFATLSEKIDGVDTKLSARMDGLEARMSEATSLEREIYLNMLII